jgi:hypothetical protein
VRFTRENFRNFLARNVGRYVGQGGVGCSCPIAHFYTRELGADHADVIDDIYYYKNGRTYHVSVLPQWAQKFIQRVDREYNERKVEGQDALRILNSL